MNDRAYAEVQSVARAARILVSFVDTDEWGPTELAKRVGLHKSVVHRLLATLSAHGILQRGRQSGRYSLGPILARLNPHEGYEGALARVARPYLERLGEATGETVSLCVINGAQGQCIDVVDSKQSMRFTVTTGEMFPLNAGCIGKILLAFRDNEFIEDLIRRNAIKRYTPNTIVDPKKLRAELRKVRRLGYAFSDEEITPGARSVGAPVYGANGRVDASLVVSAPAFRMPDGKVQAMTDLVRQEAAALSVELGHASAIGNSA